MKKALYIDMDGTLARFHDVDKRYIENMWTPGFYVNMKPFENIVAAVKLFIKHNPDVEVYVLSAVLDTEPPFVIGEKNEWLDTYLPEVDKEHRIFTRAGEDKSQYIQMENCECVLLDDYNKNLYEFEVAGGKGIKFCNDINNRGLGEYGGSKGYLWAGDLVHYDDSPEKICTDLTALVYGKESKLISFLSAMEEKYGNVEDFVIEDNILMAYSGQDETVNIPNGIETLGLNSFWGNTHVKNVVIPDTVKEIDCGAFAGVDLQELNLPSELEKIKKNAFMGCASLSRVEIPKTVSYFHNQAFDWCKNLQNIDVDSDNKKYFSLDGTVFKRDKEAGFVTVSAFRCPCGKFGKVVLPDGTDKVAPETFLNCTLLTEIKLPASLSVIQNGAFYNCSSLEKVELPSQLRTIEDGVFSDCSSLRSVVIPDSIQEMGHGIFDGCKNLSEIVISDAALVDYCEKFNFLDEVFMTPCYDSLNARYDTLLKGKDILSVLEDANKRCGEQVASNEVLDRERE